jgi:two-component system chemotaxis response regulator CheB
VLLVDEQGRLRGSARPLFESQELKPVGQGCDYESALATVIQERPDILVVDLASPDALGAIEAVMAEQPTPILGLYDKGSRSSSQEDPFRALALGALDVAEAPDSSRGWVELGRRLILLSQIRVVQHVQGKLRKRRVAPAPPPLAHEPPFPLVAMAASLGGPKALSQVLRMIPRGFPAPICVCQHISVGFTIGFSAWLASETSLPVVTAQDGAWMTPGTVFIAPAGAHLLVQETGRLKLDEGPPIAGFRPSFGRRAIGVILTGMGRDGAKGLKEIRLRGGRTIAQDESTCVVYGMPAEAVSLGAAEEVLPLDEIGPLLVKLVNQC